MNNISFSTQSISLESVINARELGSYILPDGKMIRRGCLIRAAALSHASDNDLKKLKEEFKLKKIFDFRMDVERKKYPNKTVEGAEDIWLPAMDPESAKAFNNFFIHGGFRTMEEIVLGASKHPDVRKAAHEFYTSMVDSEYTQNIYARFLREVVETEDGAVYWHCTQGKDRTGLAAAFLLFALGADRRLVMQDYFISYEFYKQDFERVAMILLQNGGDEEDLYVARTFIAANAHCFEDALDLIDKKYGSMQQYLRNQLKLSDEDLSILRARYLVDVADN